MKNKFVLIGGPVLLIGIIVGVVFFVFFNSGSKSSEQTEQTKKQKDTRFVEIKSEEIGLQLEPVQNNQVIKLDITKPEGISSIEYELSYDALENGETVSRGAIGTIDFKRGDETSRNIDLGTCSSGVCKYDKGVEQIHFVLRVNFTDKDPGIIETDLSLE